MARDAKAAPVTGAPPDLEAWLAETRAWADEQLERALAERTAPDEVLAAMRYSVFGGGKRLRPALVRLVCRSLGGEDAAAAPVAAAVELIHTYSLIHDDLPCMDDDDLRRGRPTCHKAFDEATAVLAGDGLQARAFELCAGAVRPGPMTGVLARAAGPAGMVGGQALDMSVEGRRPEREVVERIHELKTAALIAASAELGALAAGAPPESCAAAAAFGRALGLAFQAVDDVLDVTGDAETLGKTPGKDARLVKPSLVAALGLEGAREVARERAAEATRLARELAPDAGLLGEFSDYLLHRDR